jgi:hypothetical protein
MNPNTHSTQPGGIGLLAAAVDQLAVEDLDALPDAQAARQELVLRRLIERLEGHWLRELAGVDAAAPPTPPRHPGRVHRRLAAPPHPHGPPRRPHRVRVARALHRGPCPAPPRP